MKMLTAFIVALAVAAPCVTARAWCHSYAHNDSDIPFDDNGCEAYARPTLKWFRPCTQYAIDSADGKDVTAQQLADAAVNGIGHWMAANCGSATPAIAARRVPGFVTCDLPEFNQGGPNVNTIAFVSN